MLQGAPFTVLHSTLIQSGPGYKAMTRQFQEGVKERVLVSTGWAMQSSWSQSDGALELHRPGGPQASSLLVAGHREGLA